MIPGMDRTIETAVGPVATTFDDAGTETLLVLAHGAGAGKGHPFMSRFASGLSSRGISVLRFDFLYVSKGKKAPDRQDVLEATFAEVVEYVRRDLSPRRLFLGGKSMGGRIATHLSSAGTQCDGLVMLGYPLHPPGRPDRIRDQHLYAIEAPVLFVEGTRDPFCPLELLEKVRSKMQAPTEVLVVEDGDHSFKVRKSSGRSSDDALDDAIEGVAAWIEAR